MPAPTVLRRAPLLVALLALFVVVSAVRTNAVVYPDFAGFVFGLAFAPDGSLLAPDQGAGVVGIRKGVFAQIAELAGVTDVSPIGRGSMYAITSLGFGGDGKLYRISQGSMRAVADLGAFEASVNPDGGIIDTNPFDVEAVSGGKALIADAAANALLIADQRGTIDWIATVPDQLVSTDHAKSIFGCPGSGAPVCGAPPFLPAQGVATSTAMGPDGAYYVGELKGFPAPIGESRLWRIEPGTRQAVCGVSPACSVVADGFTSIIDLVFGPDGTLYVVELDEQGWLALEQGLGVGGSVNACNPSTWVCQQVATGLFMVSAAAVDNAGTVHVVTNALIPGLTDISPVP